MAPQHTPINPRSLKAHFARRFFLALKNLSKNNHRSITTNSTPSSFREIYRRSRRVKVAAYESMASAVGPNRAWSRAIILHKMRNRARNKRGLVRKKRIIVSTCSYALKRRKKIERERRRRRERKRNPNPKKDHIEEEFGSELRKLVPGGEEMDMFKLLDETMHYVKCLATQVEVMRRIVNFCSI